MVAMLPESRPDRSNQQIHVPPDWIAPNCTFFITINCQVRRKDQLTVEGMPEKLFGAVSHYHANRRWWPEIFLLMPDHLHAMVSFSWETRQGMNSVLRDWKRYTARTFGIGWQRDYSDHRIRSESDAQATWSYIRENPVRAGLAEQYAAWPHVWFPDHIGWHPRDVFPKRPLGSGLSYPRMPQWTEHLPWTF